MAHGLSCSAACGIFPDEGSNPVCPALAGGFLTTAPPGKSLQELELIQSTATLESLNTPPLPPSLEPVVMAGTSLFWRASHCHEWSSLEKSHVTETQWAVFYPGFLTCAFLTVCVQSDPGFHFLLIKNAGMTQPLSFLDGISALKVMIYLVASYSPARAVSNLVSLSENR